MPSAGDGAHPGHLVVGKYSLVGEVELLVGGEAGTGKVAGADDGRDGLEAVGTARWQVAVEEVALGVQESLLVGAHAHHVAA